MTTPRHRLRFSEDERAFLQRRIAMYARVGFAMFGVFFVLDVMSAVVFDLGPLEAMEAPGLLIEGGTVVGLLIAAIVVRRGRPGVIPLYAFDGMVTMLVGVAFALLYWHAPPLPISFELYVFMAIQTMLFVHAVVVPAPAVRTFLLHVAACLPLFFIERERAGQRSELEPFARWAATWGLGVWTLTFAGVGAFVSWVVFGLRLRIRRALELGQYRLEQKLGEGGMGIVYRAQHGMLRRPTAVKLLPPDKAGEKTIRRFEREVRLTSRLTHPNTVAIYDFGRTPEGMFYYAMELLDGLDLERVVEVGGPMPPARVVHVLRQCAGALGEAHGFGLVHRDVKPANVVLCRRGGVPDVVKVVDFGLVKDLGASPDLAQSRADVLTGTPLYMAPESIAAPGNTDHRADLYSLGAVAWFLLVGRPPFDGRTVVEVCAKHLHEPPLPPSTVAPGPVPDALDAIVLRLLEKRPGDRFPRAEDLDDALANCPAGAWTRTDADGWWDAHRDAVPASVSFTPSPAGTLTVAVDDRDPSPVSEDPDRRPTS